MELTIFAGITGFNKTDFVRNFASKCLETHGYPQDIENVDSQSFIRYVKFEDVLLELTDSVDISNFLARPSLHEKIHAIERAFFTDWERDRRD